MGKIAESRLKRTAGILGLIVIVGAFVFGANGFLTSKRNRNEPNASDIKSTEQSAVTPQANEVAVLGAQTIKNSGYDVTATAGSVAGGYVAIPVNITNTASETRQLSPGLQFYIIGKSTNTVRNFTIPAGKTALTGGPITAGGTTSGILYFEALPNEAYELRFIPEVGSADFIVVN